MRVPELKTTLYSRVYASKSSVPAGTSGRLAQSRCRHQLSVEVRHHSHPRPAPCHGHGASQLLRCDRSSPGHNSPTHDPFGHCLAEEAGQGKCKGDHLERLPIKLSGKLKPKTVC